MGGERAKIKLNDREFDAEKGANLMEAMVSAGLMPRSDCGGRGRCGKFLVRVADSGQQALSDLDAPSPEWMGWTPGKRSAWPPSGLIRS